MKFNRLSKLKFAAGKQGGESGRGRGRGQTHNSITTLANYFFVKTITHLHFLVSPFEGGTRPGRGRARSKSILFAKYIKIYSPWYDVIVSIHSCLKHIDLKLFHHMGQQELAGWVPAPVHTSECDGTQNFFR